MLAAQLRAGEPFAVAGQGYAGGSFPVSKCLSVVLVKSDRYFDRFQVGLWFLQVDVKSSLLSVSASHVTRKFTSGMRKTTRVS